MVPVTASSMDERPMYSSDSSRENDVKSWLCLCRLFLAAIFGERLCGDQVKHTVWAGVLLLSSVDGFDLEEEIDRRTRLDFGEWLRS